MYPKAESAEWEVMDRVRDNMFPNFHVCPTLNLAIRKAKASLEYRRHVKKVQKPLTKRVKAILGKHFTSLGHAVDCLTTNICHGNKIPKEFTPDLIKKLQDEKIKHF